MADNLSSAHVSLRGFTTKGNVWESALNNRTRLVKLFSILLPSAEKPEPMMSTVVEQKCFSLIQVFCGGGGV